MTPPQRCVVVAATSAGRRLAADVADHLDAELAEDRPAADIAAVWREADALVLVMATAAATRLVAPHLTDKRTDPGVVVVDDAGRFAVALIGGHEGGANRLAEQIAGHLGATAVVTTASETAGLPALSDLGARFGVAAEGALAVVGGALVSGEPVALHHEQRWPLGPLPGAVRQVDETPSSGPLLWLTDRVLERDAPTVWLRPPSLVIGIGASRGVRANEVGDLVDAALAEAGLSPLAVHTAATVDAKADEDGLISAVAARGWPLTTLPARRLAEIEVPTPSQVVAAAVGTPSVAEAAALHLGGDLLVAKRVSAAATVAIARRPARGRLALVSLGPGAADLVPPRARAELRAAEAVVGYGPYVDQAAPFTGRGAELERFGLGDEIVRARRAVELARTGRAVALVGSGDVGVYAMASPTLEAIDAFEAIDVVVVPGVTAALAASALLGAPLGHDHASISLSDLLTPWPTIRERIEAVAAGDLVVAFYNPRSRQRDWQLDEARKILLGHRPGDTPVGVVRDAFRDKEGGTLTTLADVDTGLVDMATVVVVGSSRTRCLGARLVTPRDYQDQDA